MLDNKDDAKELSVKEKKALQVLAKIVDVISEGADVDKVFSDQEYTIFEISKADPGIIIGKHGHTLDAIQYLVNMIVNKETDNNYQKLYIVDIDGYRKRREESLKRYVFEKAEIVKERGKTVELYFMNSVERRLVHLFLKDDPHIDTYSEGTEPYRRVIISPQKKSPNQISENSEQN